MHIFSSKIIYSARMSVHIVAFMVFSSLAIAYTDQSRILSKISQTQQDSGNRIFIESDTGRQMLFHGINAVVKGIPYIPVSDHFDVDLSLSSQDHETLADLGVNVYRLGTMWKGVEPSQGEYNQTYLSQIRDIMHEAAKHGIYTYFDMHQDVLSEYFCGEGIPDYAVQFDTTEYQHSHDFPAPDDDPYVDVASDGFPTRQDCAKNGWPSYYETYATGYAFQQLYQNESILSSWTKFWCKLASEFGMENSLLGYELINEPWAGDTFSYPALLLPSVADKNNLQPAYDVLAPGIREYDNETLIFFAAVTWDDPVPVGFDHAPGGEEYSSFSVFAYHYYHHPQFTIPLYFHQRVADAKRLQVGK